MKNLEIPFEVADGYWLHPEDLANNYNLIRAMNLLINYYGGENA